MTQAVATRTPQQDLISRIRSDAFKEQVALALPAGVNPDRFVRATVTALSQNPDLINADRGSLFNSLLRCAQDGLLPDGREAALVMFKDRAAYLPMVGGLRKVAAKHNIVLIAYVVHEHDDFSYELGAHPTVTHKPPALGENRGDPIGAYAVALIQTTGERYLEVMSRQDIEAVRAVSRAKNSGPWADWWTEMARKTVARRLFKQLPLGDLDETGERIVRQADADVQLDGYDEDERAIVEAATVPRVPVDAGPVDPDPSAGDHTHQEEPGREGGASTSGQESIFESKAQEAQAKRRAKETGDA